MASISAEIAPGERMELRDGIFYYQKLSRRGAVALAAPKVRVDVVHRAEHRRIRWSRIEGAGFWLVLILLFYLLPVAFEPSPARALIAAGILTLVLVFFSADVFAWRLKSGRVQTEIVVDTERRRIPILLTRVQGEDPDLESLLDRLQRCDELEAVPPPKGCAVELAESWWDWFRIFEYAAGFALLGWGCILAEDEESLVGELLLFISGCVVLTALVLSYAMNHPCGVAVRAARGAMLDGEVETAAMMAKAILRKRPYHFYANFLMTFHAVMTGDLEAAAQHRDAMNGNTGRARLSIIVATLTRDLSSAPAFRRLADYARGASGAAEITRAEMASP